VVLKKWRVGRQYQTKPGQKPGGERKRLGESISNESDKNNTSRADSAPENFSAHQALAL